MAERNLIARLLAWLRQVGGSRSTGNGMISCHDALERLFEFLDGELGESEAAKVQEHLRICEMCYPHLVFEQSFRDAVRHAHEGQRAPEVVRARVLELLQQEEGETHR